MTDRAWEVGVSEMQEALRVPQDRRIRKFPTYPGIRVVGQRISRPVVLVQAHRKGCPVVVRHGQHHRRAGDAPDQSAPDTVQNDPGKWRASPPPAAQHDSCARHQDCLAALSPSSFPQGRARSASPRGRPLRSSAPPGGVMQRKPAAAISRGSETQGLPHNVPQLSPILRAGPKVPPLSCDTRATISHSSCRPPGWPVWNSQTAPSSAVKTTGFCSDRVRNR